MRVLLIEPDRRQAELIVEYLSSDEVVVVPDGHIAIKALQSFPADAVVSEHIFANHNSFELLYELRSYTDWQSIPFILFSSAYLSDSVKDSDTYKSFNIFAYLYKPTTGLKDLADKLSEISSYAKA